MSLKKVIQKLNLESEEAFIDSEVTTPDIIDQLEAEEAEAELVEAIDDAEEAHEALDESDEVEAEVDEQIAEAKATIAEAEGKVEEAKEIIEEAEKDGIEVDSVADDNGEIPAEEVVAAQEALQNLIKRTGYQINTVTVSREDIKANTLEAYKVNLEGWEEMKAKVKEGAKWIWDQIIAAYTWIKEKIVAVIPTKVNRLKWLSAKVSAAKDASLSQEDIKALTDKYKQDAYVPYVSLNLKEFTKDFVAAAQGFSAAADLTKASFTIGTKFEGNTMTKVVVKDGAVIEEPSAQVTFTLPTGTKAAVLGVAKDLADAYAQFPKALEKVDAKTKAVAKKENATKEEAKLAKEVSKVFVKCAKILSSSAFGFVNAYGKVFLKAAAKAAEAK
jgi:gls24 protein